MEHHWKSIEAKQPGNQCTIQRNTDEQSTKNQATQIQLKFNGKPTGRSMSNNRNSIDIKLEKSMDDSMENWMENSIENINGTLLEHNTR